MGNLTALSAPLVMLGMGLFGLAAVQDAGWRLVSNAVPLAIALDGACLRALQDDLPVGLAVAALVFVLAAACWRRGWMGGADVKLFGAGALLVPPAAAAGFVVATVLAGGVLACVYWTLGRFVGPPAPVRPSGLVARIARVERRRLRRGGPLPYAMALTAGACFILTRS